MFFDLINLVILNSASSKPDDVYISFFTFIYYKRLHNYLSNYTINSVYADILLLLKLNLEISDKLFIYTKDPANFLYFYSFILFIETHPSIQI